MLLGLVYMRGVFGAAEAADALLCDQRTGRILTVGPSGDVLARLGALVATTDTGAGSNPNRGANPIPIFDAQKAALVEQTTTGAASVQILDGRSLSRGMLSWSEWLQLEGDMSSKDEGGKGEASRPLEGWVYPGFHDAHVHLTDGARALSSLSMQGVKTKEEFRARLNAYVASDVFQEQLASTVGCPAWITGGGWDENQFEPGEGLPDASWFADTAAEGHCAMLMRYDVHSAVVNHRALAACGIWEGPIADPDGFRVAADPVGGIIVRDDGAKAAGLPTGLLRERAIDLAKSAWRASVLNQPQTSRSGQPRATDSPPPWLAALRTRHLPQAFDFLLSNGVTSVQSMTSLGFPNLMEMALLQDMAAAGELPLRVWTAAALTELPALLVALGLNHATSPQHAADDRTATTTMGLRRVTSHPTTGTAFLRLGGVKAFADGSLGSHTARMSLPYKKKIPHEEGATAATATATTATLTPDMRPSSDGAINVTTTEEDRDRDCGCGLFLSDPNEMERLTVEADRHGLQVCVHAIGDAAVARVVAMAHACDVANGPRDRRFRVEHAQHVCRRDIAEMGRLGVVASLQPSHLIDDAAVARRTLGGFIEADDDDDGPRPTMDEEEAATARRQLLPIPFPLRSLHRAGVRCAFGSDWMVMPPDPVEGITAAATRRSRQGWAWCTAERLDWADAVRAYTEGSAYAIFAENDVGRLEPGQYADLVVLDGPLSQVGDAQRNGSRPPRSVLFTIVDGRLRWQRPLLRYTSVA